MLCNVYLISHFWRWRLNTMFWKRACNIISISECFYELEPLIINIISPSTPNVFLSGLIFWDIYSFFSFILSLCSPSFHVGIKTPVMRFRFTQSSEELQKNSSNHPRWPREPSLSSIPANQAGEKQGRMKRHRVTSPDWTLHSSRVSGLAGEDLENCPSIWRESIWKDRFLSPFMRYAEGPSQRERENERLVLKIDWGYPREMQPQTRCDRYGRLKRGCQYPWMRTTHTNTDE